MRYEVTVYRRAPGSYVAGRWHAGEPIRDTILATVQPAQLADYNRMEALLEGRRVEALVRVYTDAKMQVAGAGPEASGDLLQWGDGQAYVFVAVSPWQSGIISHFRYLAAQLPDPR